MSTEVTGTRTAPRRAAALAGALGLVILLATPANAAVPPLPGPVQDTVDEVDDIVSSDDPVADAVDTVDDTVGDVTGTDDPIKDTIEDVTGTADDVADDVSDTADDVVDTADDVVDTVDGTVDDVRDTVGGAIDTVDDATGGVIGGVVGGGAPDDGNAGPGPRGRPLGSRATARSASNPRSNAGGARRTTSARERAARSASVDGADTVAPSAETIPAAPEAGLGERLREAALEATRKLALPLALTVVVLGYVIAQYWADRKDPKLVFAPIDADHDLLSFQ